MSTSERRLRGGHEQRVDRLQRQVSLSYVDRAIALGLIVYLLVSRGDAREYYNHQLHDLVCSVRDTSPERHELRAQANCGPDTRGTTPSSSPTSTPPRSTTPVPVGDGPTSIPRVVPPAATRTPAPRVTVHQPGATTTVRPAPRTTTTTAASAPRPPASTTSPALLPGLLCTLLDLC